MSNCGTERPVNLDFNCGGSVLYVVDFGVMTVERGRPKPYPRHRHLWRVRRAGPRLG